MITIADQEFRPISFLYKNIRRTAVTLYQDGHLTVCHQLTKDGKHEEGPRSFVTTRMFDIEDLDGELLLQQHEGLLQILEESAGRS
jgi:hypothetical protein